MDAPCKIQRSIHVFRLVYRYVSRILDTYQFWVTLVIKKGSRYEILVDADYIGHRITCRTVVCLITIGIKHITISSGIVYHILSRSRF